MKRVLLLLALIPALALTSSWAFSQAEVTNGGKKPLDLPSGGPGVDEDDEDAPENLSFFGQEYEGNAFFWCFAAYEF